MTMTVAEAQDLARIAKRKKVPFVLAHTYTGHPMMMMAKEMVRNGDSECERSKLGNQGWLATDLEKSGQQQAAWRTDPKRTGISNCGGDIGTHAFVAATWVSGLAVKKVSARLNTFVKGRVLDDDFNVIGEMENGATAIITATQIAIGYKNDNGFRIYGTKGSSSGTKRQPKSSSCAAASTMKLIGSARGLSRNQWAHICAFLQGTTRTSLRLWPIYIRRWSD